MRTDSFSFADEHYMFLGLASTTVTYFVVVESIEQLSHMGLLPDT